MKKITEKSGEAKFPWLKKLFRIMKLSTFLILISLISVFASETYSQTKMLDLNMDKSTIKEVLSKIEDQSDFNFMYSGKLIDVNREVSINVQNAKIYDVLKLLFADTDVDYTIKDRIIVLSAHGLVNNEFTTDQQQKSVSGKVTDSTGATLPGVSIVVKGTTMGVITDMDGKYILSKVPENAVLIFSFVGMKSQEITVGSKTSINVTLIEDAIGIEEVVAIGYGTQKKVNLTGSVANVDFENLSNRPSTNSTNALVGTIPGLTMVQGSGQPGNDQASVNIRGMGSINASSTPLIIIDGVTSDLSFLSALSPYEIKEISVLKDAASCAIYGSRAANGVILVITKDGLNNKTKINFNSYWGLQEATVLPKMLDAWDFAKLENESRTNSGLTPYFTDVQIELMKNSDTSDGFSNTNWANEIFRTSPVQNYNISISTGTEKLKVYTDLNYYNQEGILLNTNSDRYNLRSKFDLEINKYIKLGLNISAIKKNIHQAATSFGGSDASILGTVYGTPPAAPVYYNNGNYFVLFNDVPGYQRMYNPVMQAEYGYNNGVNKKFISALTAEVNWKGFKLNSLVSYNYNEDITKVWQPRLISVSDNGATVWDTNYATLSQQFATNQMVQVENYLSYKNTIGDSHTISVLAGHTFLDSKYSYFKAYGEKFPNNSIQVLSASSAGSQRAYGEDNEYSLQSFFGRLNYDYKGRYLLEGNIRYDGSSRFNKGYRYGIFPSFSLGWRISEEKFLKQIKGLDNFKLRAGWGVLGNQDIGSNYAYASVYSSSVGYLVNGQLVNGAAITDMANDKISWESTNSLNLGIDLALLRKLEFTFDYFVKNTENMLINLPIPVTLGNLNPPYQNIGKIQNKGWELSGSYRDKLNKLNYSLNFNVSQVNNKAVDLNGQKWYPTDKIIKEGESLYSWYGYLADGIFQSQEEINASAKQTPIALPGDLKYKDISGIDGIPDGKIDSYDRAVIGKSFPEFTYGFGGSLNYENFDFNLFFQGVSNVDINTFSRINHTGNGGNPKNWSVDWLNRWTPENPSEKYPRLDYNRTSNSIISSYWLEDGSYLRLKNLELGYSFNPSMLSKIGVNKLRVYAGGQNLLTFTKVKYFDPERSGDQVRSEFYPQLRIYQIGINLTF